MRKLKISTLACTAKFSEKLFFQKIKLALKKRFISLHECLYPKIFREYCNFFFIENLLNLSVQFLLPLLIILVRVT